MLWLTTHSPEDATMKRLLLLCLALAACTDPITPGNPGTSSDGETSTDAGDSRMTCLSDANCFNGFHCAAGFCVPDDVNTVPDAGTVADHDAGTQTTFFVAEIITPRQGGTAYEWDSIVFNGVVSGDTVGVSAKFHSSVDGDLDTTFANGEVNATAQLSEGNHIITLRAERNGQVSTDTILISVCTYAMQQDFSTPPNPDVWRSFGSALYVADGWIDMTNNQLSTYGQFFNVSERVPPSDLDMRFRIYTGPLDAGADGFSMTIMDAPDVETLEDVLNCMSGLGNHFSPLLTGCELSVEELVAVQTFSIEFDTYANGFLCSASMNWPVDPTCEDHVAITRNGSGMPFYWLPENWGDYEACGTPQGSWTSYDYRGPNGCKQGLECIDDVCVPIYPWLDREVLGYGVPNDNTPRFWAPLENIEDSQWHEVHIVLDGTTARVEFDGMEVINATVPMFAYKGGYLGFTGGSGAIGNFHRFDDLRVKGACVFAEPE